MDYVAQELHRRILLSPFLLQHRVRDAMREAFKAVDDTFLSSERIRVSSKVAGEEAESLVSSGTVACVVLLRGTKLYIGNLGDSRCVICRGGKAMLLTKDHRPADNEEERRRVKHLLDQDNYLNGCLAVSRAIGDLAAGSGQKAEGLLSDPDYFEEDLTREDEFLIIACDGVFDVMSCQEAVNVVRRGLREATSAGGGSHVPEACARKLLDAALQGGTTDNVSAIVIVLQTAATPSTSPARRSKGQLFGSPASSPASPARERLGSRSTSSGSPNSNGTKPARRKYNFQGLERLLRD